MKVESLDELEAAFAEWRVRKKHAREAMPEELITWAQRAAEKHGVKAVVRVTRVERSRLFRSRPGRQVATRPEVEDASREVPRFSRLELTAPSVSGPRPLAEVETMAGVKLRVFEGTAEMLGLLSAVCGLGGAR